MGRALTITSAVIIIAVGARASSKERVTEAIVLNIDHVCGGDCEASVLSKIRCQ